MTVILFDIETRDGLRDNPALMERAEEGLRPDARLKDPAKVQADLDKKRAELVERSPLDYRWGRIVCITARAFSRKVEDEEYGRFQHTDLDPEREKKLLTSFGEWCQTMSDGSLKWAGFNVRDFDIPFMVARLVRHDEAIYGFPVKGRDWRRVIDLRDFLPKGSQRSLLFSLDCGDKESGASSLDLSAEDLSRYASEEMDGMSELFARILRIDQSAGGVL